MYAGVHDPSGGTLSGVVPVKLDVTDAVTVLSTDDFNRQIKAELSADVYRNDAKPH